MNEHFLQMSRCCDILRISWEIKLLEISVIGICLLLNAILSCVEMAFVTVSKPHLRKLSSKNDLAATKLLQLKEHPERVLSVLQIGITLVGAVSAAVGGAGAEEYLSPLVQEIFAMQPETADTISIFAVVIPLTYLSVVIGELVPKTLALRFPLRLARIGVYPLILLSKAFYPAVYFLEVSTKLLILPLALLFRHEKTSEQTESLDLDSLTESHKQYVMNLISVDKRRVKDILVPWQSVTRIPKTAHHTEVLDLIRKERHTRIPVVDEQDHPIGVLHAKEFISEVEITKLNWNELIRPLIKLPAEENILSALKFLQSQKSHMAIIQKKEQILGVVTLEDIFEEVVGDIYDEDDNPQILLSSNSKIRTMNISQ
jgi:putative hemolysin